MRLKHIYQEKGSVVLLSMLLLGALSLLGVSSLTTSSIEYNVANNDKDSDVVFYNADTTRDLVTFLINEAVEQSQSPNRGNPPPARPFRYMDNTDTVADELQDPAGNVSQATFYQKLMFFDADMMNPKDQDDAKKAQVTAPELSYSLGGGQNTFVLAKLREPEINMNDYITVNIYPRSLAGSADESIEAVEFGSAADGVGFQPLGGGAGGSGKSNYYDIWADGTSERNSRIAIISRYRQILRRDRR